VWLALEARHYDLALALLQPHAQAVHRVRTQGHLEEIIIVSSFFFFMMRMRMMYED
jgi:hypothetical protein